MIVLNIGKRWHTQLILHLQFVAANIFEPLSVVQGVDSISTHTSDSIWSIATSLCSAVLDSGKNLQQTFRVSTTKPFCQFPILQPRRM